MDVERTVEFLLEQQARFAEQINQHDARLVKVEEGFLQVNTILVDVATSQERSNEITVVLAERQVKTEEIVAALAQRVVDVTNLLERHIASHT